MWTTPALRHGEPYTQQRRGATMNRLFKLPVVVGVSAAALVLGGISIAAASSGGGHPHRPAGVALDDSTSSSTSSSSASDDDAPEVEDDHGENRGPDSTGVDSR